MKLSYNSREALISCDFFKILFFLLQGNVLENLMPLSTGSSTSLFKTSNSVLTSSETTSTGFTRVRRRGPAMATRIWSRKDGPMFQNVSTPFYKFGCQLITATIYFPCFSKVGLCVARQPVSMSSMRVYDPLPFRCCRWPSLRVQPDDGPGWIRLS